MSLIFIFAIIHRSYKSEPEVFILIDIKGLTVNFGEQTVFSEIDWFITPKSRIGLVGDNGAGKTTMLRVIAASAEPSGGTISIPKDFAIGYLPQDLIEIDDIPLISYLKRKAGLEFLADELLRLEHELADIDENSPLLKSTLSAHEKLQREFEARGGFNFESEAKRVLKGLGFRPERDALRLASEFSGGWKMRIALSALLLSRTDIILLDEPTNHLDTESMEWLESWLRDYKGTIIAVSHDRRFLDNIVTSVAELSEGKLNLYSCGYEKFLTEREERRARLIAEWEQQKEKIENIQRFVERFRYKATKATQVQSRIRQLEKMEITELDGKSKSVNFRFPPSPRSGLDVIKAQDISKIYGENIVFKDINLGIQRGERVALVGVNGAGKSTLLRLLNKSEEPDTGSIEFGLNVKKAYFSQESALNLDYTRTIWQEVDRAGSKLLENEKRNLLGAFLFSGDDIHKKISVLSGGEKSRVGLLKMLLSESNLLILDEPTNHLDQTTKELFQKALLEYCGTILIVSHDRAFLDDLVGRVIEIRDGALYDYHGNYSWFIEKRASQLSSNEVFKKTEDKQDVSIDRTKEQKRAEAMERNRIYQERKAIQEILEPLEKAIEEDESRKQEIELLLCDAKTLSDSSKVTDLMIELKSVETRLLESYPEWEELALQMEDIK